MDVFEFREKLISDYSDFTRSFTRIKAEDLKEFIDKEYTSQKYWPAPLVQVNPSFRLGPKYRTKSSKPKRIPGVFRRG